MLFCAVIACARDCLCSASINHDKVHVCVPFPAVNAEGETTGGLQGSTGNDACKYAPLGSQVYGRAGWYKDVWAIMYAWYFPKGFFMEFASRRRDWKSVVVWINNPGFETPMIAGASMSKSGAKYAKETKMLQKYFVGSGRGWETAISNTSLRFKFNTNIGHGSLDLSVEKGEYQDLIMWEQLTGAARAALNDGKNFRNAEVPISDEHFEKHLDSAWPL
ncbi:NPP1-like protein [Phytophthora infestans T30-4]|uniref:NPP1-like protein n=1 Tax=Phytophthora infestans (strain T30-4) TaxID=403677 RepID=D0NRD2_PHYIT|nr:NPP1-like protein [Phytophthora infestans T30-4]EEY63254.1 NPP1-like protein [Phytophthora infestans T30-4]|eukprot:XP_002898431.1 NPP1-like protein [Phytophthora infestans T30-4]